MILCLEARCIRLNVATLHNGSLLVTADGV